MNFELTDSQRLLSEMLARFIADKYTSAARDRVAESALGYSRELWQELASLGVIGALFSEADGGFGGSGFDIAVVFECLGRGLVLEPFLSTLLAGRIIAYAGNSEQRQWINKMMSGESLVAFAHEESDAHYTMSHVGTRAQRGAAEWTLNGAKVGVVHGESADLYLVSGRTEGNIEDHNGISLFLVPATSPGIAVRGFATVDGARAADLSLVDVRVPHAALVGATDSGLAALEYGMGYGVLGLCAEALGAMEQAKATTVDYLRARKQFGQCIGTFQALQHRMATLLVEIEQARSSVINAAYALTADRKHRERAVSAAKHSIGRIGTLVAEEVIQLHGAVGMTWDLPLAHYAKRLVMIDHQLGDEDFHLERYIELGRTSGTVQ
jgi:alkylation response protein AidB-like acyl-CoA dehydrogenase